MREDDVLSASGRWENYHMEGEHAHHRFIFEYPYRNSKFPSKRLQI